MSLVFSEQIKVKRSYCSDSVFNHIREFSGKACLEEMSRALSCEEESELFFY